MNIYSKKQRWKLVLSLLAILISVASVFITNKLVKELKSEETKKIEIWAQATKQLVNSSSQGDFSLAIKVVSENRNIPVILVDECDSILETRNIKYFPACRLKKEFLKFLLNIVGILLKIPRFLYIP